MQRKGKGKNKEESNKRINTKEQICIMILKELGNWYPVSHGITTCDNYFTVLYAQE